MAMEGAAATGRRLSSRAYAILTSLIEPLAGPALALWNRREAADLREERLGRGPALGPVDTWWHAASLGEVAALRPVLDLAVAEAAAGSFAVTTTSASGRQLAARHWPGRVSLAPLDLPRMVARVLDARRPRAVVLVETELWPTMLRAVHARGIPLAVVNGRLSARAWNRTRGWTPVPRRAFAALRAVAARTPADAERFRDLGVAAEAIRVTGNTKHDREPGTRSAQVPWNGIRLWTAGSLRPGEEREVLEAFARLRRAHPDLRLAVVPRHPERWPELSGEIARRGFRVALRSHPSPEDAGAEVLLVDTRGELESFYLASSAAFVGGTFVPIGGHNVMEAAAAGIPVVVGPHTGAVQDDVHDLGAAGALEVAGSAEDLVRVLEAWLREPGAGAGAGSRGAEVARASRGAARRTLDWLRERGVLPGERAS